MDIRLGLIHTMYNIAYMHLKPMGWATHVD